MKTLLKGFIILGSIFITLLVVEIVCLALEERAGEEKRYVGMPYPQVADDNLGYALPPNSAHQVALMEGTSVCYDVIYRVDGHARRTVGADTLNKKGPFHLSLFGDSVTFGEGLNDSDTVQYKLSELGDIANHAVFGYGPQHTLAILEDEHALLCEGRCNLGVYILIPSHGDRASARPSAGWLFHSPRYVFENGEVVRGGFFDEDRRILTDFYRGINWLFVHSATARRVRLPSLFSQPAIDGMFIGRILGRSADLFRKRTNAPFVVVIHPMWNLMASSSELYAAKQVLEGMGVPILDYSSFHYGTDDQIPCDGHPNGSFNERWAPVLRKDLFPLLLTQ